MRPPTVLMVAARRKYGVVMRVFMTLSLIAFLVLLILLPLLFAEMMATSLTKLNLDSSTALPIVVAIMLEAGSIFHSSGGLRHSRFPGALRAYQARQFSLTDRTRSRDENTLSTALRIAMGVSGLRRVG